MKVLTILILCIGFLAVNFLLKKAVLGIKSKNGVFGVISRYFPVAELIFWSVFIVWAVDVLFASSQFFIYIVFLLITLGFVLFFFLFVRDYTTGVQLKSRYNLSHGQRFKSGQLSGTVKRTDLLYIEIKADNGTDYKVPYSQIDQKSIELDFQDSSGGETLISIDLDRNLNQNEAIKKIAEMVINSPWCSHKSIPKVNILESESGETTYEVSCILIGDHAARNLKEIIERGFAK